MNIFFFQEIILFVIFRKILTEARDCESLYTDCFNCTTCGENEGCFCSWVSNSTCQSVEERVQFPIFFQTFYNCDDSSSNSIKEEYCGSSTKTLGDDFTFSLPVKFGKVGTRSIYCEYNFIVSDDDDIYYNIDYKYDSSYSNDLDKVNLYLLVKFEDYKTSYKRTFERKIY